MGQANTFYAFHLNLIRHGREVCIARNPRCSLCWLTEQCDYYQSDGVGGAGNK
jgi:endonuclease-3